MQNINKEYVMNTLCDQKNLGSESATVECHLMERRGSLLREAAC